MVVAVPLQGGSRLCWYSFSWFSSQLFCALISQWHVAFFDVIVVVLLDLFFVGLLLYGVYRTFRGNVAVHTLVGFLLLPFTYWIASAVGLKLGEVILRQCMNYGVLMGIVLFQKELRKSFFEIGRMAVLYSRRLPHLFGDHKKPSKTVAGVTAIVEAVKTLAGSNTGALIVISNTDDLKSYKESGDLIDALVSKRLLLAIFNKRSPLHDGSVIITHNKIASARSILPITERRDLPAQLGLRHRAAIGMTEVTTTLVLVISEETGQIAMAKHGTLESNLTTQEVRVMINDYLQDKHKA